MRSVGLIGKPSDFLFGRREIADPLPMFGRLMPLTGFACNGTNPLRPIRIALIYLSYNVQNKKKTLNSIRQILILIAWVSIDRTKEMNTYLVFWGWEIGRRDACWFKPKANFSNGGKGPRAVTLYTYWQKPVCFVQSFFDIYLRNRTDGSIRLLSRFTKHQQLFFVNIYFSLYKSNYNMKCADKL